MKKIIVIFALIAAIAAVAAGTASATVVHPNLPYCVGGHNVTSDSSTLAWAAAHGSAVEVFTYGLQTFYYPDFDNDPADATDDATVTAGVCPKPALVGGGGNYYCTPADNAAPFLSPNWNDTMKQLANGNRNPYWVPGTRPNDLYPQIGGGWLDCGTHTQATDSQGPVFVDASAEAFSTPGLANQPGWYPKAVS